MAIKSTISFSFGNFSCTSCDFNRGIFKLRYVRCINRLIAADHDCYHAGAQLLHRLLSHQGRAQTQIAHVDPDYQHYLCCYHADDPLPQHSRSTRPSGPQRHRPWSYLPLAGWARSCTSVEVWADLGQCCDAGCLHRWHVAGLRRSDRLCQILAQGSASRCYRCSVLDLESSLHYSLVLIGYSLGLLSLF